MKVMSQPIFFTGDLHFGHRRMADQWRSFGGDIDAMNETLIENWNSVIPRNGIVYNLGDFSFATRAQTNEILSRLNGEHHFIKGNHDSVMERVEIKNRLASFNTYKDFKIQTRNGIQQIVLFHFPVESWHGVGKGAWHLHGHCHGNLQQPEGILRLDVGVDNHDFKPWSVDEITDHMESQLKSVKGKFWTPSDHHQAKGEM